MRTLLAPSSDCRFPGELCCDVYGASRQRNVMLVMHGSPVSIDTLTVDVSPNGAWKKSSTLWQA